MRTNEPISRSEFLRGGLKSIFGLMAEFVDNRIESNADKMIVFLHRPPGSVNELSFLSKCTRCDLCMEACPHKAIIHADAKAGAAVGTPIIEPGEAPCFLCEDMPCIRACPEGALLPTEKIKMGTAYISKTSCFSHTGHAEMCDYCYTRCPLKDQAIIFENNKPIVIAENCTGCGICEYFCPAPGNAIKVVPERNL